jgi:hypothetical protein
MAFTKENIITNYEKQFDYKLMRKFVAYSQNFNEASQVLASHGTKNKFITTGGQEAMLGGLPTGAITAHTDYDPSAQVAYAVWATAGSYLAVGAAGASKTEVFKYDVDLNEIHYACILAHTSASSNEPGVGADWETYWRLMDEWATDATGHIIAAAGQAYYLFVVDSGGWIKAFVCEDSAGNFQIPAYDPARYVAIAFKLQDHSSGASPWVFGTTLHDADSSSATITQIVGSTFPDASLIK